MSVAALNPSPLPSPAIVPSNRVPSVHFTCHKCSDSLPHGQVWQCGFQSNHVCTGKHLCYRCGNRYNFRKVACCWDCLFTKTGGDFKELYQLEMVEDNHGHIVGMVTEKKSNAIPITVPLSCSSSSESEEVIAAYDVTGSAAQNTSAKPVPSILVTNVDCSSVEQIDEDNDDDAPPPLPSVKQLFAKFTHYLKPVAIDGDDYITAIGRTPELMELYIYVLDCIRIGSTDLKLVEMEYALSDAIYVDSLFLAVADAVQNLDEFAKHTNNETPIPCILTFDALKTLEWAEKFEPDLLKELKRKLPDLFIEDKFYWFSDTFRNHKSTKIDQFSIDWHEITRDWIPKPSSPAYSPASPSYCPQSPVLPRYSDGRRSPSYAPVSPTQWPDEESSISDEPGDIHVYKRLPANRAYNRARDGNIETVAPASPPRSRALIENKKGSGKSNDDPIEVVGNERKAPAKRVTRSQSHRAKRIRFQE